MSSNNQAYIQWKRFSDFKLLAEYAKISDLRESVVAWRRIQQARAQVYRLFWRCHPSVHIFRLQGNCISQPKSKSIIRSVTSRQV